MKVVLIYWNALPLNKADMGTHPDDTLKTVDYPAPKPPNPTKAIIRKKRKP